MVREILKKHRLSVSRLARTLGIRRTTVQYWMKGKRNPSSTARFALKLIHTHGLDALLSGELGNNSQRKLLDQSNKRNADKPGKAGPQ